MLPCFKGKSIVLCVFSLKSCIHLRVTNLILLIHDYFNLYSFSLNHFYLLIFLHLWKFNFYKNLLLRQKPHSSFDKICVLHTLPSASIISGILSRTNLLYTFIMTPLMKPSKSRNLVFLQNRIPVAYFSQGCL